MLADMSVVQQNSVPNRISGARYSRVWMTMPAGFCATPRCSTLMREAWLPSQADLDYVKSLMTPVYEPGKVANWIAAPFKGINGQPADFDYVRF